MIYSLANKGIRIVLALQYRAKQLHDERSYKAPHSWKFNVMISVFAQKMSDKPLGWTQFANLQATDYSAYSNGPIFFTT